MIKNHNREHQLWRSKFKTLTAKEQREWLKDLYIEHAYFAALVGLPPLPIVFDKEEEDGCREDARRHIRDTNQYIDEDREYNKKNSSTDSGT